MSDDLNAAHAAFVEENPEVKEHRLVYPTLTLVAGTQLESLPMWLFIQIWRA